eukprot:GILJ01001839.1.p1 GENE.GILJ01001839.1~~GILJ01001839.1.p1  ORF type:complete len:563 (-),score=92.27 GILJ01001839.1:106-1794(-)
MESSLSSALHSTVELSVSCRQLKNTDLLSKSDPLVALDVKNRLGQWESFGRTERIKNNLNPDFAKSFQVPYMFEEVQVLRFRVYDIDNLSDRLDDDDFLGEVSFNLGELMGARGQCLQKSLGVKRGFLIVKAEEVAACREQVCLRFSGTKIENKDGWFGKSDPFLTISRLREDGSFQKVHQTEVIKNSATPHWREFTLPLQKLCNGDHHRPLLIQCYDWDDDGSSDFIGEFQTSVAQLATSQPQEFMAVNSAAKAKNKKYSHSGLIHLEKCQIMIVPTFLDYIRGGCELNLIAAVDFTGSNGDPRHPQSLHFWNPQQPNEYARSLQALAEILLNYDADGNIPAYGFGAVVPPLNPGTLHCFPLNMNPSNAEVCGVAGLMQAYFNCLQVVTLSGPTIFSQVIQNAISLASQYQTQAAQKYFVLLIITDGVINDMDDTVRNIVQAADLPLSIVIVGVGNADFSGMVKLDGDDGRLRDRTGREAARDIVQFVAFRDYGAANWAKLATDTLAEIPSQLVSSMLQRGLVPNPPIPPVQFVPTPAPVDAPATATATVTVNEGSAPPSY